MSASSLYYLRLEAVASTARTSVELDERLVAEAMRLTGKKTKTELVNHALEQLVSRLLRRRALLDLEGKVEWSGDLDRTRETRAL